MLYPIFFRIKLFFSQENTQLERIYHTSYGFTLPRVFKKFLWLLTTGQWGVLLNEFYFIDHYINCFDQWLSAVEADRFPECTILTRTVSQPDDYVVYQGSTNFQKPPWMAEYTHTNNSIHVIAVNFLFNVFHQFCEHNDCDFKWWYTHKFDMVRYVVHLQKMYIVHVPQIMDETFPNQDEPQTEQQEN